MKNLRSFLFIFTIFSIALSNISTQTVQARPDALKALANSCFGGNAARATLRSDNSTYRFVGTQKGKPISQPQALSSDANPEDAARSFMNTCGSLFGISGSASVGTMRSETRSNGRSLVRFQQYHQSVPVIGGEMIFNLDENLNVLSITSDTATNLSLNVTPTFNPNQAKTQALNAVAENYQLNADSLSVSEPQLWIYLPELIGPSKFPAQLVWRMEVKSLRNALVREFVLVNANRGGIVLSFNQIDTAWHSASSNSISISKTNNSNTFTLGSPVISVYDSQNTGNQQHFFVCDQSTSGDCASYSDGEAGDIYNTAFDTYEFYEDYHSRDSIDNAGLEIILNINWAGNCPNAFWDGDEATFCNGLATNDIVSHELTHGVTQYESGLFYYYQSGAINESLSDVWGEFLDQTDGNATDGTYNDSHWRLGEESSSFPNGLRSMSDPTDFGDPDKITSSTYYTGASDAGGVHTNSGVNNKAAYLLAEGEIFNGYTITALGIPKTAAIYYEVQTNLLTSGSDYADLGNALVQACENLVGTTPYSAGSAISDADCEEVYQVTLATEMDKQPASNFNTDAPMCPVEHTPNIVFSDNFESNANNGSPNWILTSDIPWSNDPNYWVTYAHSGTHALYGDDYSGTKKFGTATQSNTVAIPPSLSGVTYLHFYHAFGFQSSNYDGGILEYSKNGGAWTQVPTSWFDYNGYNGTIKSGTNNPLTGKSGWVNDSHGYISSRVNLNSLAGSNSKFRFKLGRDGSDYNKGWWVDDFNIYTCTATGSVTSENSGVSYSPSVTWGEYTDSAALDGSYATASLAGRKATFVAPKSGTSISLLTFRGPNMGKVKITVDSTTKTIDLYATSTAKYTITFNFSTSKVRTIIVEVTGQKRSASTGTNIRVDGFKVGTTSYQQDLADYNGWLTKYTSFANQGQMKVVYKSAATPYLEFTLGGSGFTWVTSRGPAFGQVAIFVSTDGGASFSFYSLVDLYNANIDWQYQYTFEGFNIGDVIKIQAMNSKHSKSTGFGFAHDGIIVIP